MTDETPTPTPEEPQVNYEEVAVQLYKQLEEHRFFSDQVRFNSTLFQGFNLILQKLVKLEEKLEKIEEKLNEKTKPTITG